MILPDEKPCKLSLSLQGRFGVADELIEGLDYTMDEHGQLVFTAAYLLERGECCGSGCRNCPYRGKHLAKQETCGESTI
jgi:hypothetical protein